MIKIDGKQTALDIQKEIAQEVEKIKANGGKTPHLAAVLVGNDGASETYVGHKVKACERVGFESTLLRYDDTISEDELLKVVEDLNQNPDIDGFIVQFPVPKHISETKIVEHIAPEKDVDGLHPINIGRVAKNLPAYVSATPQGILTLLERYKIETSGKHCVVLGRSQLVGRPLSILLSQKSGVGNCTVTVCHSRTPNVEQFTKQADILVAAMGMPGFVKADMVKEGAVVIDVGTTRVPDDSRKKGFRLSGDVHFAEVAEKSSYITPVPGGVGPMTVTSLLQNTLLAAQKKVYK
ncbi:bifunctional methylenetetrahydrofolate dehydrogenase/methenyltetrahydrofolate cyclohydrolase FolD [uncultured Microscilla sp.]|uniref:bifunctional methylenetetrahydrofolate dehydrogenase/methenyltetrahydrofolate cyclohydrolase FolD n=1 Tax=uncultured Microscilla sp. TaxID=432653 RepID=UPI0026097F09|nr:bifunctional methylenetetrahydrofolate dehydrogenase/methenyltetrahydrofolate cyclohydrolase FolD [uncultured Microscilla sp.]